MSCVFSMKTTVEKYILVNFDIIVKRAHDILWMSDVSGLELREIPKKVYLW